MIKFIHRKDINTDRWDEVIANSSAETIYPYSWYLDAATSGNWSALILDDYSCIMPLIHRKKFGINYLYHPSFVQQLGVFSKELVDPVILTRFIDRIPSKFKYGNLQFNTGNLLGDDQKYRVTDRKNYELNLTRDYHQLYSGYSTNTKRNLKRSTDNNQQIIEIITLEELIRIKRENNISDRDASYFEWMTGLFSAVQKKSKALILGSRIDNKIAAGALFAFSRKRAIYLLSVSDETGKEMRSMFGIVDHFIQQNAGSDMVLDFEGSQIPSIARFFSGFGATPKVYQTLGFARFPVSLFKRKGDG